MRISCFLALAVLVSSCDDITFGRGPEAQFDPVAVRRPLDLTRKLGTSLALVSAADTFRLRLGFDAATGQTVFTTPDADTVLAARVFRFRGLYYFVQNGSDGADWVHAVRLSRRQVQGLHTGFEQMLALSRQAKAGAFPELVRFRNATNDSLRLRFDTRQLRGFYTTQLDSLPIYQLLTNEPSPAPAESQGFAAAPITGPYPNPAQDQATLDFATAGNRLVTLYDSQGRRLRTWPTSGARCTFSVADLPVGSYGLRISQVDGKGALLTRRLLVAR